MKKQKNKKELRAFPTNISLVETIKEKVGSAKTAQSDPQEDTRSKIAKEYVRLYFITIFAVLLIGFSKNFTTEGYKDLLLAVSGVLSGTMGIMIGFYFKDRLK